ncbi:hypothetical protein R4Z10_19275 [Niallia sp. XMNu-256]|uniref:hypothetical protein n=1 Tax=Niallia sp. XMNu-256 TaxID=3082444 RepID=UPI0030D520CB
MNKRIFVSFALAFTLLLSGGFVNTGKAEAADWSERGSIWTTYYHSGYFSNYVYQRTFQPSLSSPRTILAGVSAKSSASGSFKVELQRWNGSSWYTYRTKYATKNGSTSLTFYDVASGSYRMKFTNIGSTRVNYTFWVKQ